MRRQARKRSRPPYPEAADDLDRVIIQDSNLNVSAGGVFYEKAKSRRQRHRLALMSSDQSSDAVALGKSINRGPGGTADLPGDIANERAGGKIGEDAAEKVRELIDSGRAAMAAKSRSSRKSFTSRTIPSISRMRLNKSQSKPSGRAPRIEAHRSNDLVPGTCNTTSGGVRISAGNLERARDDLTRGKRRKQANVVNR
jgi:hypothetical protein